MNLQNLSDVTLTPHELSRYSRHIFLKEIGKKGQLKLKKSTIIVIGAGGLGSPLLLYLTAAGIGKIKVIDYDIVSLTNLQRQILYRMEDVGRLKSEVALDQLIKLNPEISIEFTSERLTPKNAYNIIDKVDLVVDGSDNFATRFLVNDVCYFKKIPLITGGVLQFYGMVMGIIPQETPCYRCLFERPPEYVENCSTVGVLGPVVGVIGTIMATEVIKFLLGLTPNIMGNLLRYESLSLEFRIHPLPQNESCSICGKNPLIKSFDQTLSDYYEICLSQPSFLNENS